MRTVLSKLHTFGVARGVALLGTILLAAPACGGLEPLEDFGLTTGDGEVVTKQGVPSPVQAAFDRSCNAAGCHDSATAAAGLSLAKGDSDQIIGGPTPNSDLPLVELGSVHGSYLAIKMLPDSLLDGATRQGALMPLIPASDPVDISTILGWIAGAPFDESEEASEAGMGESAREMNGTRGQMDTDSDH